MGESSEINIWIDIKNAHEPILFKSIISELPYSFYITARDYAEIRGLLEKYGMKYKIVGKTHMKNIYAKAAYFPFRTMFLQMNVPRYDYMLSHGSIYGIVASKLRFKKSITIFDVDFSNLVVDAIYKMSSYLILPSYVEYSKFGVSEEKVYTFDGFKEDIYLADLDTSSCDIGEIPFKREDFVVIRPEAYKAYYVPKCKSIVEDLIKLLLKENFNIVLLPRYTEEREKYRKYSEVYIPERPINGACACWLAKAVLTGSGTMAREAACIGTIAVSFYPGEDILSVDRELIRRGWLYHSRDPKEIVEYVLSTKGRNKSVERCKKVKKEVINIIRKLVEEGS